MDRTRASTTARLIAAGTVMAARDPNHAAKLPADAVAWSVRLLSATRSDRFLLFTVRSTLGRACWRLIERLTIPGILNHWMRRKQRIEHYARHAASEGFTQLVVVGAGLDTLPFRMHAERVFELILVFDHPATQALVRQALSDSVQAETNIELIPIDLGAENFASTLSRSRQFDPDRPTLFLMEGVLMYLPARTVLNTLSAMSCAPCPRLRLIATYMDTPAAPRGKRQIPIAFRPQSALASLWLRTRGETMLWSVDDSFLAETLACVGWRLLDAGPIATLHRAESADDQHPDGENIFVAERNLRPPD